MVTHRCMWFGLYLKIYVELLNSNLISYQDECCEAADRGWTDPRVPAVTLPVPLPHLGDWEVQVTLQGTPGKTAQRGRPGEFCGQA